MKTIYALQLVIYTEVQTGFERYAGSEMFEPVDINYESKHLISCFETEPNKSTIAETFMDEI